MTAFQSLTYRAGISISIPLTLWTIVLFVVFCFLLLYWGLTQGRFPSPFYFVRLGLSTSSNLESSCFRFTTEITGLSCWDYSLVPPCPRLLFVCKQRSGHTPDVCPLGGGDEGISWGLSHPVLSSDYSLGLCFEI